MQWRIPQVRLIWALPGEGELSQNLWDMSNFGKIDFKLYEISYICLITSAIHVLISHLFSVKKRRMPVHPRMARIVLSMGRGIGERCTFLADCFSGAAERYARTGTQGHLNCACTRLDDLTGL